MKRLVAIVLGVVTATACVSAPRTRSFQDLPKYIHTGGTVTLADSTGLITTGTLQTLSPTSLTILSGADVRDISAHHVTKIQRRERWVGLGALTGLAVGFGVGLISADSRESTGSPLDAVAAGGTLAVDMLLGTAIGAILGAVVKVDRTMYVAPIPSAPPSQSSQSIDHTAAVGHPGVGPRVPGCRVVGSHPADPSGAPSHSRAVGQQRSLDLTGQVAVTSRCKAAITQFSGRPPGSHVGSTLPFGQ